MTCFQCNDDFFKISGTKSIVSHFSSMPFDICTRTLAQEPSNMKFTVIMTALVLITSSALGMPTKQSEVHQENCYFLITTFKFLFMLSLPYMTFCTYDFLKKKLFKYHLSKITLTKEKKEKKD
jgi:hypothetical protein